MDMSSSEPVPDDEEDDVEEGVPENKWALDNLAEGFWLFKTAFDFFYDMDPSMIWALKLKQMLEEWLVPYRNILREMKKEKVRQKSWCLSVKLHWICLSLLLPLPSPPPLAPLSPLRQQVQLLLFLLFLRLLNMKMARMKTLDFPGGTVVKNLPANAGDIGSSPGPGRSHMPRSN